MGGHDVIMRAGWIRILGPITMDLKELYSRFTMEGNTHHIQGHILGSPKIISYNLKENLFKKGHFGIITQFNGLQIVETPVQDISPYLR